MNFPLWEQPAPGLLIALIAIVHVFVAHVAVGGGLFLVITERRARRTRDTELLAYLERQTRVFALLTLVFGALTGVGIWFVIGLVHPSATTTLIQLFLWMWAIEWTFFVVEIAAALVYAHGWRRLPASTHQRVGWVYAVSAWMSLAVINGILSFMLTPGDWLESRSLADAFFNPTYAPSLVARTATAVGLAGLYALLTASWMTSGDLKARLARYACSWWMLPAAIVLPLSLAWFLSAAAGAGIDVGGVFGASSGSVRDLVGALRADSASGHPIARGAAMAVVAGGAGLIVFLVIGVLRRPARFGPVAVAPVAICALVAFGGAEFVREDLRKPYVITGVMFVNGVRVGPANDPASIAQVNAHGILASARFVSSHASIDTAADDVARLDAEGRAIARLLCATCHTTDGYLALRPLVRGRGVAALDTMLSMLAVPVDAHGHETTWDAPHARLRTWRGRFMPPFVGTDAERHALAVHLALLGGTSADAVRERADADGADSGQRYFDANCAMCHGAGSEFPLSARPARSAEAFYEMLGRLPEINEVMSPFDGDEGLRRALAAYLATLSTKEPR